MVGVEEVDSPARSDFGGPVERFVRAAGVDDDVGPIDHLPTLQPPPGASAETLELHFADGAIDLAPVATGTDVRPVDRRSPRA